MIIVRKDYLISFGVDRHYFLLIYENNVIYY
jgi:hypothetical protein